MQIEKGAILLTRREISDLVKKWIIEGPLEEIEIIRRDSLFKWGSFRCYREALRTARERDYQIFTLVTDRWISDTAHYSYAFYRFVQPIAENSD